MRGSGTLKKIAPFLAVVGIFTAVITPLGLHTINELTPYLNLADVMMMPEALEVDSMEVVDKKYDKTAEEWLLSISKTEINTNYPIYEVNGIFLQSEYGLDHPINHYNRKVLISDNSIDLSEAPLPGSGQIPVVVEYTIKEWTSITWLFNLKLSNRGDNDILFPAANVTIEYLDDTLGEGWILHDYEVRAHQDEIINLYLRMENNELTSSFVNALLLGLPLELTGVLEAYILIEDANGDPLLPIKQSQKFDFVLPAVKRGPPPFIWSLTRGGVSAYEEVEIIITATDEGTGINARPSTPPYSPNEYRSYIYYSIDNGISWERTQLKGPPWDTEFKGRSLEGYYPISSTFSPQTYSAEIPGFPGGTQVLFYVYLEDYADNIDHEKPGNWATSQTYSYVVPSGGMLSSFSVEFEESTEDSIGEKFFNWLDENGFNQDHFLSLSGIKIFESAYLGPYDPIIQLFEDFADLLYDKDVDSTYVVSTFLAGDSDFAGRIIADSGVAPTYLLIGLGIDLDDLFTYIVDHIFLPVNSEFNYLAQQRLDEIFIVDDLEGSFPGDWSLTPSYRNEYDDSKFTKIQLNDIYTIEYSDDDAWTWNQDPRTNSDSVTLELGGHLAYTQNLQKRICLRYNLTIPKNAVILNAYLNLTVAGTGGIYNGFTSRIWTFDTVSTPDFSDSGENIMETRSRVPEYISWPMPYPISINQAYLSQDIASLLQNIVNRDNWQSASENSIFGIYIDASTDYNERLHFHSVDLYNPDYTPKLIVNWAEPPTPTYKQSDFDATDQLITTDYNIINVIGVWNTSDHSYGNLYNESNGDYFTGNYIILKTPQPLNQTALWIRYESDEIFIESDNIIWINSEPIGTRSLKWVNNEPSILICDDTLNYVIDIEEEEILTFYLKYDNYTRLNGKISFNFVDNLGRKMRSNPIEFMNTGSFQEIPIPINLQNFRIDNGFDFEAINKVEFEYSGTEQVNVWIDYLCIYSRDAYSSHRYFTYDLQITNERIDSFLDTKFLSALFYEDIINEADWRPNYTRTSYWNFLDLIATSKVFINELGDEEFNQHMTAANLLLEWWGVQKHFEALCSLIGAKIDELEPAITDEDIYPYAQKFAMTAIYLSLGFIASLVAIKRIGRYRTRKKIEEIRKKYGKK